MTVLEIPAPWRHDRTRRKLHEVVDVAPVQWKIANLRRTDGGGQLRIFRIDFRRIASDLDHLLGLT